MKTIHHPNNQGFSLIEVIVAMGIVSTVMVGLIGIMPSGVASLHEASTVAIQSRIVQELVSDAQQSTWNDVAPSANTVPQPKLTEILGTSNMRKYDSQGNLLTGASGANQSVTYVALTELDTASTSTGGPVIMGYGAGYTHLRRVNIYVEYTPGGRTPSPKDITHSKFVKKYSLLLANMGTNEGITGGAN